MNQDYYFPLFGLFATAGKIFLLSEGGGEQSDKADPEKYARQRRGRFLRLTRGGSRHWQDWIGRLPLRKNNPAGRIQVNRENTAKRGRNGNGYKGDRTGRA